MRRAVRLGVAMGLAVVSYRLGYRAGMVQSACDDVSMDVLRASRDRAEQAIADGVDRFRRGGGMR
jgi:hypothetical protein